MGEYGKDVVNAMTDITTNVERVSCVLEEETASLEELNAVAENLSIEGQKLVEITNEFKL